MRTLADGHMTDSTNIANATIFGLREDLGIAPGSTEYNTALTIFFVPYILFEIPSNIILKKLKPHVWCTSSSFVIWRILHQKCAYLPVTC
jgi:hypothetical protein